MITFYKSIYNLTTLKIPPYYSITTRFTRRFTICTTFYPLDPQIHIDSALFPAQSVIGTISPSELSNWPLEIHLRLTSQCALYLYSAGCQIRTLDTTSTASLYLRYHVFGKLFLQGGPLLWYYLSSGYSRSGFADVWVAKVMP